MAHMNFQYEGIYEQALAGPPGGFLHPRASKANRELQTPFKKPRAEANSKAS